MYPTFAAADDPGMMDRFHAKITEFKNLYAQLLGARPRAAEHPALMSEYQALLNRGGRITASINGVIAKAQGAWDFMKSAPGAAYDWIRDAVGLGGNDDAGLGFIPLVVGAAALGVIALIASWTNDTIVFLRKIDAVEKLTARGMPIDEASRAVQGVAAPIKPSATGNLATMAMWAAVAAIAIFVVPKFLGKHR